MKRRVENFEQVHLKHLHKFVDSKTNTNENSSRNYRFNIKQTISRPLTENVGFKEEIWCHRKSDIKQMFMYNMTTGLPPTQITSKNSSIVLPYFSGTRNRNIRQSLSIDTKTTKHITNGNLTKRKPDLKMKKRYSLAVDDLYEM